MMMSEISLPLPSFTGMVRALMRLLLAWLLLLGVTAGIQQRVLAADPCEVLAAMHEQEHSSHPHDHEGGKPCDSSHDEHCPLDHHEHGCFCHGMPLADASDPVIRLNAPGQSLARLRHEREAMPEGPFLSEDKPPLI